MDIGIIGLGAMGSAMAKNLAAAGHQVKTWNRSGGSVDGVTMVGSPVEALQGDAVLTTLSDDASIRGSNASRAQPADARCRAWPDDRNG